MKGNEYEQSYYKVIENGINECYEDYLDFFEGSQFDASTWWSDDGEVIQIREANGNHWGCVLYTLDVFPHKTEMEYNGIVEELDIGDNYGFYEMCRLLIYN